MVAHNPLHGSGQAAFPHPALTSGINAQAASPFRFARARREKRLRNCPFGQRLHVWRSPHGKGQERS